MPRTGGTNQPTNQPEIFISRKRVAVPDLRAPCRYPGGPVALLWHNNPLPDCEFIAGMLFIAPENIRRHIRLAAYPACTIPGT